MAMVVVLIAYGFVLLVLFGFTIVGFRQTYLSFLRLSITGCLFSGVPTFLAVCILIALVKPSFAPTDEGLDDFELNPAHEPLLFEFIQRLCVSIGAPQPASIVVNQEVNAGASLMHGVFSDRLRLTIGLPLVLGLNARQLAGVIAHEFGHFSQTGAMRANRVLRQTNVWFIRAAFERDAWDQRLNDLAKNSGAAISWLFWSALFVVFLARKLMVGLFCIGHFFSASLMQEMEFDSDRFEARVAGSQSFARTCSRMRLLMICHAAATEELDRYRRESRLPDNFSALVVANVEHIKIDKFRQAEREWLDIKTQWYDSHPSDRERIANAASERAPGTFQVDVPASHLFTDVDGLSRVVTLRLYQHAFGCKFNAKMICNTADLIGKLNVEVQEKAAGLRFFLHQFRGFNTAYIPRFELGKAIRSSQYKVVTLERREKLMFEVCGYCIVLKQEDQLMDDLAKVTCAKQLIEAGYDLSQTDGSLFGQESIRRPTAFAPIRSTRKANQSPIAPVSANVRRTIDRCVGILAIRKTGRPDRGSS